MSELLAQLHAIGLPMTSRYAAVTANVEDETGEMQAVTTQRYVGWTTDKAKADAAEEAGASLRPYTSKDPRFAGWEVNVSEVLP